MRASPRSALVVSAANEPMVEVSAKPMSLVICSGMTQGKMSRYSINELKPLNVEHEQFRDIVLNGEGF